MEKETYTPQNYTKVEKLKFENCFFCLHDQCCDICTIFKKIVDNWNKENEN